MGSKAARFGVWHLGALRSYFMDAVWIWVSEFWPSPLYCRHCDGTRYCDPTPACLSPAQQWSSTLVLCCLELFLLITWSNPAVQCSPVLLCHQIIRYFSTSRGHCVLPYALLCSGGISPAQWLPARGCTSFWWAGTIIPRLGRVVVKVWVALSPAAVCQGHLSSSPALSIALQTQEALLVSGLGQGETGIQKGFVGVGKHFLALSTHLSRGHLDYAFSVHCGDLLPYGTSFLMGLGFWSHCCSPHPW